jgi:uncharacterized protein YdaU (DUF1376 family)
MDWYRWFPVLYSEATLGLNLEQDAIYRRLIDWYMLNRMPLPCQPIALARICQISLEKWHEHSEMVLYFFRKRGERFHHKRCDIELDRQDSTSKRLGEAAKKAHEARRKNKAHSEAYVPSQSHANAEANAEEKRGEVEEISSPYGEDVASPQKTNGALHAKQRRKPTSFISEDFGGDLGCIALAGKLGLDFEHEQRRFIDHWLAKGESRADWQASFRTWLNNSAKYRAEREQRNSDGRQGVRDVTGAVATVIALRQQKQA